jgi:small subunit ribosomal protein S16
MAVKIRLQRFGAKKKPYYRIVAADARSPRDGRFLEQVGTYNPMVQPEAISFVEDRLDYWMTVGAEPSDTVASLVRRFKKSQSA